MTRSVAIIGTRGYPSYYGGFETAVRQLAPYLAEEGWDVEVFSRAAAVKLDDPERDHRVAVTLTQGLENRSLSTLSYGFTAMLRTMRTKPDAVLVMNVANGFLLPFFKLRGIPTVVNVDGIEWERDKWSALGKFVFRLGARFTARFADHLVFDAAAIGDYWQRTFSRSGTFIPYGGQTVDDLPAPEGLPDKGYVLFVARFVPENTVAEFFEAAQELSTRYPVVIVGSSGSGGTFDEQAAALAAAHDGIQWLGHVNDDPRLFALWQHAGAYFHGHSVGGTNPALVQAMACGARIVARDTVYNREVLGPAGVFCAPDPESIVAAVDEALAVPSSASRAAAIERAARLYNWPDVCAAYARVLSGETRD